MKNTLSHAQTGVNFINALRTAFALVDPKSVRTRSSRQYLFTLLGSTSVKAVRRTLMKSTPGCGNSVFTIPFSNPQNVISIFVDHFSCTYSELKGLELPDADGHVLTREGEKVAKLKKNGQQKINGSANTVSHLTVNKCIFKSASNAIKLF